MSIKVAGVVSRFRMRVAESIRQFGHETAGSIQILFALTFAILLLSAGLAIDYGNAVSAKTKLSNAIDAAALAASLEMREHDLSVDEAKAVAQKYLDANLVNLIGEFTTINSTVITADPDTGEVTIAIDAQVKTFFGPLAQIDYLGTPAKGAATTTKNKIEVAIQIDNSWSMDYPDENGVNKLVTLKNALNTFIDLVVRDSSDVMVGFAPYSGCVNAGSFTDRVAAGRPVEYMQSIWSPSIACFYERVNAGDQATDLSPSSSPFMSNLDLGYTTATNNKIWESPTAKIVPLTNDKAVLKAEVAKQSARGPTAGHLGTAFAWYLLSPLWNSVWDSAAAEYDDERTHKIALLMTDGYYTTYGGRWTPDTKSPASETAATSTCTAMKAKGIIVFVVFFDTESLPNEESEAVLRNCASTPESYVRVDNAEGFEDAFKKIASQITTVRLSN